MDKVNIIRAKSLFHLSTFVMDNSEDEDERNNCKLEDQIEEFVHQICHATNRSQAIDLRTNALEAIDQWRLQCLDELDQRVRVAGQSILNAFDEYQNKRRYVKCAHRSKQSSEILRDKSSATVDFSVDQRLTRKIDQEIEISIDRGRSSSTKKKISLNSIDFGHDFIFETLAHLSTSSTDIAMTICENNTLIYSQHSNELIMMPLSNPNHTVTKQLNRNLIIRDLCDVHWLLKCLIIGDEEIYLLDYRTNRCDMIESGIDYICGAIDNHEEIFYLVKQSTLYKYDQTSLATLRADQYPIADGYRSRRVALDNKSNDYLALLVMATDEKNYILVYSTRALDNGYIYKIMIDDEIEREWICSNGNEGWLIRGSYPGSCWDLNINGLASIRVFDCNEVRNILPINEHQRFLIRTNSAIFLLIQTSSVHSF